MKIKTFSTSNEATLFECRFLTRINAKENPLWYNQHNGHPNSDLARERQINTNQKRYGFDYPFQNLEVRKKAEQNRVSSFKNPEVQSRIHDSEYISPFSKKEVQDKAKSEQIKVNRKRYGCAYPFQNLEVQNKIRNTRDKKK